MKRGTASRVVIGGNTMLDLPKGLVFGTDVILGGIAGLTSDFNGLVLSNTLMLGKKISHISVITVIVRGQSPLNLPYAIADSLHYVKAFGGTEQRNLPDGYIERQFIYMMDGSYLLTDIVPTYDGRVEMDFQTTSIQSGATSYLGGRSESYPAGLRLGTGSGNSRIVVTAFSNSAYTAPTDVENNTRYKFTFNNKVATLESGGSTLFTNTFTGENANGAALVINGLNSAGTITPNAEGIYLYSFKVWNGQGELVADYIPAVQKGTVPVVGFYDTVSKTFKTATAGTFAAGGEAVPTPDAPMDIVSNNGVLKYGFNYYSYNVTRQLSVANYPTELDRSVSYSDGVLTCGITGSVGANRGLYPTWNMSFTAGHKYACVVMAKGDTRINLGVASIIPSGSVTGGSPADGFYTLTSDYAWYAKRWECNTDSSVRLNIRVAGTDVGQYASFKDILVIDLTAIFGAGNEPTTSKDIIQRTVKIYTDGTVETIGIRTRNLYDANSNKAFVEEDTQYTISLIKTAARVNIAAYDTNDTLLEVVATWSSAQTGAQQTTFTTPENTKYIACATGLNLVSNVQIEQGSAATDYVPYFDGGTATAEMLLKVGDYQDVQSIIDGVVTRNVGVKVLDGTENIGKSGTYSGSFFVRSVVSDWGTSNNAQVYCSHFSGVTADTDYVQNKCMILNNAFNMWWASDSTPTVAQFQQWLADQYNAGAPVIICYPLATATTESVAGQALQVQAGDNTLEITQASMDDLELEASYDTGVVAIIQEVQDVNLNNNVTVTIE